MGIAYGDAYSIEEAVQLGVIGTEINQSGAFLLHQRLDLIIVIALVFTAQNQDDGRFHTFQSIPTGIDISSFRVVDILYTAHLADFFSAVLDARKVAEAFANGVFFDTGDV